ncbi:MAG: hypothetical protein ACRCUS_10175 [Anaerovoracaceae bacterium]
MKKLTGVKVIIFGLIIMALADCSLMVINAVKTNIVYSNYGLAAQAFAWCIIAIGALMMIKYSKDFVVAAGIAASGVIFEGLQISIAKTYLALDPENIAPFATLEGITLSYITIIGVLLTYYISMKALGKLGKRRGNRWLSEYSWTIWWKISFLILLFFSLAPISELLFEREAIYIANGLYAIAIIMLQLYLCLQLRIGIREATK